MRSDKEILKELALKGPLTIYALSKLTVHSTSTVHAAIQDLMEAQLVKRIKDGYSLTLFGLIRVLQRRDLWRSIDEIISSNRELSPGYFDLWDDFKKWKVEKTAAKLLKIAVARLNEGRPDFPDLIDERRPMFNDWLPRLAVDAESAYWEGRISKEEASRWHLMLIGVPKAEEIYVETLRWMKASHEAAAKEYSKILDDHFDFKRASTKQ